MSDEQPGTTLYVLVPPSPLFAAHWSFFLPDSKGYDSISKRHEESPLGRRIHVAGDRLHGFKLEMIREYDVSKHRGVASRKFPIGIVPGRYLQSSERINGVHSGVAKDEDEGGGFVDNQPRDEFERLCTKVEAPGPSLNPVSQGASGVRGQKGKVEVRDCQYWVREVVHELTIKGMLEEPSEIRMGQSKFPVDLVAQLPPH
ncbi:hypothetical protein CERZMDRAFT_91194 [Cercospora zeae-maydis SCOH1-5]|uniref:Uncharacterized protein n=1 Tax=Cercospora zeae-maydis SCOH1-5 TaxID=717836 RepID=A0A6A6F9V5_9PEZI|nr:hypothetical protein CERZMDRAFT_91194 [Cercospora zeae-maydis SCOH1-5]